MYLWRPDPYGYYETGTKDLKSMTFGDETLTYTWYEDGLKKTETWDGTVNGVIKWDYDSYRRPEQITVGNETPVVYGYDEYQRLSSAGLLGFEYYVTDLTDLSPESGKLAQVTLGESAVNYYYDYKGLPYETVYAQNGADKLTFTYFSRDEEDRITGIIENDNGITKATVYEYDSFGRLMRVKNDGEIKTTYYYDTNGNRTHRCTPQTGCIELHYNAQDQLTKYGTNIYTYTLNGELKTKGNPEGVTVYDHDPMGNLVQVILPNSTVIGYTYDAKNRRVAKMVNGFITERLIYKNQLAPVAKLDADGNILEEYVYGTGINSPDYIRKDGVNYRVIKDHLGSTRMVVNASTGEVVKEIRYSEFGEITDETGTFNTIFGFAGGLQDRDTGLIHFGARWYDPETGRWIKKDPIMFDGGLNHYAYVSNDPINKIDPTGLAWLYFSRSKNTIELFSSDNKFIGEWKASNIIIRSSLAKHGNTAWSGDRKIMFSHFSPHLDNIGPDSQFGHYGNFVFDVGEGWSGVGVHAGRENKRGYLTPTEGCVRVATDGMKIIHDTHFGYRYDTDYYGADMVKNNQQSVMPSFMPADPLTHMFVVE